MAVYILSIAMRFKSAILYFVNRSLKQMCYKTIAQKLIYGLLYISIYASLSFAGNPFIWKDGNADPTIRVFNNTAYLYPSHDSSEYVTTWLENDFKNYSSTDLVHWTDNGVMFSENDITWAKKTHQCWAPDMHYYNGYYYFYFCINRASNSTMSVGVARSTSPSSGFTDYLGTSLVSNIDPSCYSENDSTKYFTWGQPGGLSYGSGCFGHAMLNPDMKSFKATPVGLCITGAPSVTEACFIFKRNNLYYLIYGTTSNGVINYGTSTVLGGSYTYKGNVITGYKYCLGTGHGSVFQLNGQWYLASHMCIYSNAYYRKTGIWYLHFKDDGTIEPISQPGTFGVGRYEAFDTLQAENYYNMQGVIQKQCSEGGYMLTGIHDNAWVAFPKTNFLNVTSGIIFNARVASTNSGSIEIRKGSPTGILLGTCAVTGTGGLGTWQTVTATLTQAPGLYESDLYFVFKSSVSGDTAALCNCNWFRFTTSATLPRNAYNEFQAENYDTALTVTTSTTGVITGSGSISGLNNGDYLVYKNVYFGTTGPEAIDVRYRSGLTKAITKTLEFRVDSRTGPLLGIVSITDTTNTWRAKFSAMSPAITGLHDLYVNVVATSTATNSMDIDMFRFIEAPPASGIATSRKNSVMQSVARRSQQMYVYSPAGGTSGIVRLTAQAVCTGVYSAAGRKMPVEVSGSGSVVNLSKLPAGIYIIKYIRMQKQ